MIQTSPPQPLHLRQPRHHRYENHNRSQDDSFGHSNTFRYDSAMGHDSNDMLQLSMHMPSRPFSNRFEVLAVTQAATEPRNQFHVPNRYRRSRNSRGTKEAKRRRDARRSRRKLAAQLLDEQLSRDIDATLNRVDIFPQVDHSPPSPLLPVAGSRQFDDSPRVPTTPPQLPDFDFPMIDMDFIPQLAPLPKTTTPPTTPPAFCIPSWCPNVPALTRSLWTDSLPKFFDLSSLPEPKETVTLTSSKRPNVCQELQLWRGNDILRPKQSRFFPAAQSPPKPIIKIPSPTGCTLHITGKILPFVASDDVHAPPPYQELLDAFSTNPTGATSIDEPVLELKAPQAPRRIATPALEPSAANLWRILINQDGPLDSHADHDLYLASLSTKETEDAYSAVWSSALEICTSHSDAAELDNTEVPYVHANSLTDTELSLSPYVDEHSAIRNSAICFLPQPSPPVGLNELLVDNDIAEHAYLDNEYLNYAEQASILSKELAATSSGTLDTNPVYHPSMPPFLLTDTLPVDCIASPIEEKDTETILVKSDAHFLSEQSLFDLPSQEALTRPNNNASSQSTIDLADFLKLGHAKNCWCPDCEEEIPELVPPEKLEEGEEEWMVYSPSSTVETASQTAVESVGDDEDDGNDVVGRTGQDMSCSWQDWCPSEKETGKGWDMALERYRHEDDADGSDTRYEDWDYWPLETEL